MEHLSCLHCAAWRSSEPAPLPAQSDRIAALRPVANEIPSFNGVGERTKFRTELERLQDAKAKLERDMEKLRGDYRQLYREKAITERDEQDIALLLDPVRVLPTEVLQRIFMIIRNESAIQSSRTPFESPLFIHDSLKILDSPWNVSQVSQRWRAAALSYPDLWSLFGYPLNESAMTAGRMCLYAIQLDRSRGTLLNVSLNLNAQLPLTALPPFLAAISRWKCLTVTSPTFALMNKFLAFSTFPSLVCLDVELRTPPIFTLHEMSLLEVENITMFRDAPQLREASASSVVFSILHLPLDQLQSISIVEDPSGINDIVPRLPSHWENRITSFWAHIRTAKTLQKLRIADELVFYGSDSWYHKSNGVLFPLLHTLSILSQSVFTWKAILSKAPAIALNNVHLELKPGHEPDYLDAVSSVLSSLLPGQNSKCCLTMQVAFDKPRGVATRKWQAFEKSLTSTFQLIDQEQEHKAHTRGLQCVINRCVGGQ